MSDLKTTISESFVQYAGAVLQSRALVDVRDCLKPSARQIFYALHTDKFIHSKPYKKTLKAVGSLSRFYIHGDSSAVGVLMRAGQQFAMRYPLVDVKGNAGTLIKSGNWAHQRYTESRLAEISSLIFSDIDKDTIAEWRDNYDDTEQYPAVLPSKGFYNIVNGTMGIGIGAASSIPQFNIRDVNEALIKMLWSPDVSFEEIYCAPDFATGGILLNEDEVKESLKNGTGFACKIRSVIEFDNAERCFIVKEIPYSVYTNTICDELEAILNDEEHNPGIDRFNDLTGVTPNIKIYLSKKANPDKVLKYLFKNTFLQYHYGINFTMLDNGRFPRVFGWKEMLQAHIDHERVVYRRAFEFDLNKIKARIHIIDGLLICMARIEEVVQTIRKSASTAAASTALQSNFLLDEAQAKAVLDMKLSRLAHLEVQKLESEREDLMSKAAAIEKILNDEELFKDEIKKGWREVAEKFGDARRTKIINIAKEDEEPTEIRSLQISMTNKNNIHLSETSTLYKQKRGGVGNKAKLEAGEYVIHTESIESNEEIAFFTARGDFYHYPAAALAVGEKIAVEALLGISEERIVAIGSFNKRRASKNVVFFTKNGFIKKSLLSEYNLKRSGSLRAINLDANDEIASILFIDDEDVGIMTELGNFIRITTKDIRPIGRIAKGIRGIKLNDGDAVCCAYPIKSDTQYVISVTNSGLFKKTPISEFTVQGKNTKGAKIHKLTGKDIMADFIALGAETEILVASSKSCIKLSINDVPTLSRVAQGAKAIKMNDTDKIIGISLY